MKQTGMNLMERVGQHAGSWPRMLTALMILAVWCGCGKDDATGPVGSGGNREVLLGIDKGVKNIRVAAGDNWSAFVSPDSKWVWIDGPDSGQKEGRITVGYKANGVFPRMAALVIRSGAIRDTIFLKQYWKTPVLEFVSGRAEVAGTEGRKKFEITTNLPLSLAGKVKFSVTEGGKPADWITDCKIENDLKTLSCRIGESRSATPRQAILTISFTDEWGTVYDSECLVSQAVIGGSSLTRAVTFGDLRGMVAGADGSCFIEEDIALEGIVVSDCGNANVAANPNLTAVKIDYSENARTIYLQSADGVYGVCLKTTSEEVNTLRQYDCLKLWLKGLTLRKDADPERYTLSGVGYSNLMTVTGGSASDVLLKERSVADLTDADLYTFVTLKACEIPIREGGLTPINEGYASVYGAGRIDCYPRLIRDEKGGCMFLLTNVGCGFRRDGTELPAGSGSISGVIVHETFSRFEEDGDIGRYQIRPLERDDIALNANSGDGFSRLIAEWNLPRIAGNVVSPGYGAGTITHTSGKTIYASSDYSLSGPITGKVEVDNKGSVPEGGFSNANWWDKANDCGEGWVIGFSTRGIASGRLSMQFATVNLAVGAPRYWVAEWSDHGLKSGAWNIVREYTVPDIAQWSNTLLTQLPGHKNVNIDLPSEMLGKDAVYVRLRAARNSAGTASSYDGSTIVNGAANTLSYVAVRYDK